MIFPREESSGEINKNIVKDDLVALSCRVFFAFSAEKESEVEFIAHIYFTL